MRGVCLWLLGGVLLAPNLPGVPAIVVELSEIVSAHQASYRFRPYTNDWYGPDPIESGCNDAGGTCVGILTRDGSLDLTSRYGCTDNGYAPENVCGESSSEPSRCVDGAPEPRDSCGVTYGLAESESDTDTRRILAGVNIALHPDSVRTLRVFVDGTVIVEQWEAASGSDMQSIPGVQGSAGEYVTVQGLGEEGDYIGFLEVEIYVEVDEIEPLGVSAATRTMISTSATADDASAANTLDGDTSDASSWTCSSAEGCEIVYDLQEVESLEQVRIAFSGSTDDGGKFSVFAAGESGDFVPARTGLEAGGRPSGSDDLLTFGGVRALARYVKVEALPASGGTLGINEIEFRVGEYAPQRPVAEKPWLKETGPLPAGREDALNFNYPNHDVKSASDGGCDSPGIFDGCHIFYIKDGDLSEDSRWTCGPASVADGFDSRFTGEEICFVEFSLNQYRYVRQIQLAFHLGDQQHNEFEIQALTKENIAYTANNAWATVVPSVITSGDTTEFQTFNVGVHTNSLRILPKFQRVDQTINIKEMIILEKRKKAFVEGTVPVLFAYVDRGNEQDLEPTTSFKFDIKAAGERRGLSVPYSMVSAVKMRFPSDRTFVFDVQYKYRPGVGEDYVEVSERFTSAGGNKMLEEFTFSEPRAITSFDIVAVEGPTFTNKPWYPTLRVNDLQVVGEIIETPGELWLVSTGFTSWSGRYKGNRIPDIITEASSDQKAIMTAICETKGATFDGTDCVGELNDSSVTITIPEWHVYVDGPIFIKSGVRLGGSFNSEYLQWTEIYVYDGPNSADAGEDAVIVIDSATGVEVEDVRFRRVDEATGPIVPGTLGNIGLEIRNSTDISLVYLDFVQARNGAARFTDSSNISAFAFWSGTYETGNFMELTRVDNLEIHVFPEMAGLRIDTCNNVKFIGPYDNFELPDASLDPPTGGDQTANVVITGDSSGVVFRNTPIGTGTEPRILVESTEPLVLAEILEYVDAVSGDCIVQFAEGSTEDSLVQLESEQPLVKSGDCWVLP